MNLYRGCAHDCVYCDGRTEKYQVNGEFGENIEVKVNAVEILTRELNPQHKRFPFKPSYLMLGGGVGDSYQPAEIKYQLTKKTLQLLSRYDFPIHILTKSTLVRRDVDILEDINRTKNVIISFSFSSADDGISQVFEPGVPPPSERLETIAYLKDKGFACGIFLLPVIPFITDTPEVMKETIQKAKESGVDFIIFGGMTLKEGKQKDYFEQNLKKRYPQLLVEYQHIYKGDRWGNTIDEYTDSIHSTFWTIMKHYHIPVRIPPILFNNILDENDLVIVILEHLDYLLKLQHKPSPYGYAAYQLSKINMPLSSMQDQLTTIKGIGKATEKIINEILRTKSSTYYETLLT
jgi:DNA repair photolyase